MSGGSPKVCRLVIRDKYSNLEFLVDTGAEVSVIPPTRADEAKQSDFQLFAANGSPIKTYGVRHMCLNLGLRRNFNWEFFVAAVTRPILGADFLQKFNLLVDLKNRQLIDNETTLSSICSLENIVPVQITTLDSTKHDDYTDILKKYPEVFKPSSLTKKIKHSVVHHIETKGPPVYARARRLPPDKLKLAKKEFQLMVELGICRPSKSNWASPIHLVNKKDNTIRPCGDYRALNNITLPDKYPLPHIHDFNMLLSGSKVFSKIDLVRAFNQIPVNEADIPKTAVITPFGLFEFLALPFGLRNAAQTFQRFIHEVFQDLDFCFIYIDDILVFSPSEKEHRMHLNKMFQRLEEYGLTVNVTKSVFGQPKVAFLGYEISEKGISPLPERVQAILNYSLPQTVSDLKRFLGVINFYRRSLPKAAEAQLALTDLTQGAVKNDKTKIVWNSSLETNFNKLKQDLANATLLAHPDSSLPFSLSVDASNRCVGAVLQQHRGNLSEPLAFFSKKLSSTEQKYSTYDRELLAIYLAVKHFRHFLEGREFTIFTDHKPLTFAFTKKNDSSSPRVTRQLNYLAQFCTNIQHVSGKMNVVADAFSRLNAIVVPQNIPYSDIAKAQVNDTELKNLISSPKCSLLLKKINIPDCREPIFCDISTDSLRPYIPNEFRKIVFDSIHQFSHPGINASIKSVQSRFVWPNLKADVRKWAQSCIPCQTSKIHKHTKSTLGEFQIPNVRFSHVNLDIIGPLPSNNGFTYCVTIIDRFTRWPEAVPVSDISAETVAKAVYANWICRFGAPSIITTDQGRQFESELFNNLVKFVGAKRIRTTAYHPQANGKIERWHRCLKNAIRCHLTEKWVDVLPHVMLGLRSSIIKDLNTCPAEMVYGQTIRLPGELLDVNPNTIEPNIFLDTLRNNINKIRPVQTPSHASSKHLFVHPELHRCEFVFIRVDHLKKSLQQPYTGPFKVLSRDQKLFKLQIDKDTIKTVSIDRLKPAFFLNVDEPQQCESEQVRDSDSNSKTLIVTRTGRHIKPPVRFQ